MSVGSNSILHSKRARRYGLLICDHGSKIDVAARTCKVVHIDGGITLDVKRTTRKFNVGGIEDFDVLRNVERPAVLDGDSIDETVIRHIPCGTVRDVDREVPDIAVVDRGFKVDRIRENTANLVLLIRSTSP